MLIIKLQKIQRCDLKQSVIVNLETSIKNNHSIRGGYFYTQIQKGR